MSTATAKRVVSPPEYAAELGVDPAKVLAWIKSGELTAVNLATRPRGRARWGITRAAIEAFESLRASPGKTIKPTGKTKPAAPVDYFA